MPDKELSESELALQYRFRLVAETTDERFLTVLRQCCETCGWPYLNCGKLCAKCKKADDEKCLAEARGFGQFFEDLQTGTHSHSHGMLSLSDRRHRNLMDP